MLTPQDPDHPLKDKPRQMWALSHKEQKASGAPSHVVVRFAAFVHLLSGIRSPLFYYEGGFPAEQYIRLLASDDFATQAASAGLAAVRWFRLPC